MAITKLTNTQIDNIVNTSYLQFTGQEGTDVTLDLSQFADTGTTDPTVARERFTGALAGAIIRNWYTDVSYRSSYDDDFYEDSASFGAILQVVSASVPEVKDNSAWKDFVSGITTVGQYTVYLPVVESTYYTKQSSWELPITITGTQWNQAFRSREALNDFVSYLWVCVDNALVQHMKDLNNLNKCNFIAEKIHYASQEDATGIHKINFVEEFAKDRGIDHNFSVKDFLQTPEALLYMSEQMRLYVGYLQEQTALFNTQGKVRFTPKDRLVVQILDFIEKRIETVAMSDTFHDEMVALPRHKSVPAWQTLASTDFETISSINVKIDDNTTVNQSGIIGFICDKWAIIHTIVSNRVGSQHFGIEDLTLYAYQHTDKFMNNLSMNAIVFTLEDYEV